MKAYCYDWFRSNKNLPSWLKHAEYMEITWAQIQEVFDSENDIMLLHSQNKDYGPFIIINVSAQGFGQR